MILFRLISFGLRIVTIFAIVFILQIQFDGKTLESYLVNVGKKIIVVKVLNRTSTDASLFLKSFNSKEFKKNKKQLSRKLSSQTEDYKKRFNLGKKEDTKQALIKKDFKKKVLQVEETIKTPSQN